MKVKCDRARPECRQCLKSGRKCEGYSIWTLVVPTADVNGQRSTQSDEAASATPASSESSDAGELLRKSLTLPQMIQRQSFAQSSISRYAFDYFVNVGIDAYAQLSNHPPAAYAVSTFAIREGLQTSMWHHLVAAIGLAFLAQLPVLHTTFPQVMDVDRYDASSDAYTRALEDSQPFRARLGDYDMLEPILVILMALYGCELIAGNHVSSLRYLRYFRGIAQTYPEWYVASLSASNLAQIARERRGEDKHTQLAHADFAWLGCRWAKSLRDPYSIASASLTGSPSGLEDGAVAHRIDPMPEDTGSMHERLSSFMSLATTSIDRTGEVFPFASVSEASVYLDCLLEANRVVQLDMERAAQKHIERKHQRSYLDCNALSLTQQQCLQFCIARTVALDSSVRFDGQSALLPLGLRSKVRSVGMRTSMSSEGSRMKVC